MRSIGSVKRLCTVAGIAVAASLSLSGTSVAQSRSLLPSEANLLRSMSDANILGHLVSVDSFEIALSDSAILKSKSDTVIAYARNMRSTHLASRTAARSIARELGLPLTTINGEMRRTHVFAAADSLANASEAQVDRHYLTQQIELHDHMLAELALLQDVAKNERVRENVRNRIPIIQGQLDWAYQVAKTKGYDIKLPGRRAM